MSRCSRARRFKLAALALALVLAPGAARPAETDAPPVSPADLAAEVAPFLGTKWFGLYLNGQKCGYMASAVQRVGERVVVLESGHLKIAAMGGRGSMRIVARREYDLASGALVSLRETVVMGGTSFCHAGRVEGGAFVFEETVSGRTATKELPVPEENLRDHLAVQRLVRAGAKPGTKAEAKMFEPTTQQVLTMQCEVLGTETAVLGGVETRVARVAVTVPEMPALNQSAVVDAEGQILETEMGLGGIKLKLRSEPKELARKFSYSKDLLVATLAPADRPIEKSERVTRLVARVRGMPEGQALFRDDRLAWQEGPGGTWTLTSAVDKVPGPSTWPEELPEGLRKFVKPTPYIQSDAEEIQALAKKIAGEEPDPYRAAVAINDWVYANIAKVFTPAASNALDTLRTRRGDCGEHAALAVALCRARGLPAREVAGLAYWPPGKGFGGHAWVEVYVTGRWVALDPAFGQSNADAMHIKFAEGGFSEAASMMKMAPIVGALKFEILEVKR